MRRSWMGSALIVVVLALPAVARWWLAELPAGADSASHILRAVQLEAAWQQGVAYPRWAADMVFGYGYPLFNFYGPGAQVLVVLLHRAGLSLVAATLAAFALADVLAALGAWALGRRLFGAWAGLLASLAYVYAPYTLLSLHRGALPEALGYALLPWVLWSALRLGKAPSLFGVALTAGLLGCLPYLNNPATLVVAALTTGFSLVQLAALPAGHRWPALAALLAAAGLGLSLSAAAWLPLIQEIGAIQISRAFDAAVIDYRYNFLSLGEILSLPVPFDPQLIGADAPRALGWPQLALAGLALATLGGLAPAGRRWALVAAAGAALALALTLPSALWAWDHVPGLSLLQLPSRLLGPASLLLALVAAGLLAEGPDGRSRFSDRRAVAVVGLSLAVCWVYTLPWTYYFNDPQIPARPTLADLHAFERRTGTIGTTSTGEFLPIAVQTLPDRDRLAARYAAGTPIPRLDPESLPAGASVSDVTLGFTHQHLTLASPQAFTATFDVFDFPGWQATVDDAPVPIRPSQPHGLITLPVPAGVHRVQLNFVDTPPRQIGGAVSLGALATLVIVLGVAGWRHRVRDVRSEGGAAPDAGPTTRSGGVLIGLGVLAVVVRLTVIDGRETPFRATRFDGVAVSGLEQRLDLEVNGALMLIGLDGLPDRIAADQPLTLDLYWRALRPLDTDYSVQLTLRDAAGRFFGQSDSQNPAGFPTTRWPLDKYARDRHTFRPYPGTPPGAYQLTVAVYRRDDGTQISLPLPIGELVVDCPTTPPTLTPSLPLAADFGGITLLGLDWPRREAGVGERLPLTAYWQVRTAPDTDLALRVALVDAAGASVFRADVAPAGPDLGTREWQPGCPLRAPLDLRLPADLPGGDYTLTLGLVDADKPVDAPVAVGALTVIAPARTFTAPPFARGVGAGWGEVAELAGWTYADGQLSLVWRARGTADIDYTVFVHRLDAADTIVAQRDLAPGGGARPTTSWLAGEYLVDVYDFPAEALPARFRIGFYDPLTGRRLPMDDGAEALVLTE